MQDDHAYSELWYSHKSLFKHCQRYWGIYRYTDAYSATHRRETRGRGKASPALFENRKKCPDFGKNDPDCVHLLVKFSIQNVVLIGEKFPNCFPAGPLFAFLRNVYRSTPVSQTLPLPWKISRCTPALRHYSFCKTLKLNVWQCSE